MCACVRLRVWVRPAAGRESGRERHPRPDCQTFLSPSEARASIRTWSGRGRTDTWHSEGARRGLNWEPKRKRERDRRTAWEGMALMNGRAMPTVHGCCRA
eukprot:6204535-Pleurochrysis_carterae.AAC.1